MTVLLAAAVAVSWQIALMCQNYREPPNGWFPFWFTCETDTGVLPKRETPTRDVSNLGARLNIFSARPGGGRRCRTRVIDAGGLELSVSCVRAVLAAFSLLLKRAKLQDTLWLYTKGVAHYV